MESILSKLKERHTQFCTHLRHGWINVELHSYIKQLLSEKCEDENYSESMIVNCKSPVGKDSQENIRLKGKNLLGFVNSTKGAGTEWALQWTLVSSIALFEAFISDIATIIYMSNPKYFLINNQDRVIDCKENHKVAKILINSESREEALEKLIEEKLRSIFYGNPIDAFIKYNNKKHKDGNLKLNLDKVFHNECFYELQLYKEMVGRRNTIVHNVGIIDDKYIREVDNICTKLSGGDKVRIDKDYSFSSLMILDNLAALYTKQVSVQIKEGTWS
ncbi:hypothetical protein QUF50_03015 [Thiotrichales bacterium HSG1]|nr:hypothetical protein [Thiotrichales bacterium HSG1]